MEKIIKDRILKHLKERGIFLEVFYFAMGMSNEDIESFNKCVSDFYRLRFIVKVEVLLKIKILNLKIK